MHLKKIFIILFLYSMQSYAGLWPVVTSVTILPPEASEPGGSATITKYKTQAQLMEVGEVADEILNDYNWWSYGFLAKRQGRQPGQVGTIFGSCRATIPKSMKGKTVATAIEYVYNLCNNQKLSYKPDQYTACVGYVLSKPNQGAWDQVLSPLGTCFQLDDIYQWCTLTTPELVINHGVMSVKEAAGNRAKQTLNINCTMPAKVTLTLLGNQDTIPIGGGTSHLTSSLGALGKAISLQAGNNSVDIFSELNNVKEGEWNASAVMMMELN